MCTPNRSQFLSKRFSVRSFTEETNIVIVTDETT